MTRQCTWCDQPFHARTVSNRFCSKRCASLWQYRDRPKSKRQWSSSRTPVDSEHRKLRAQLLPTALGTPCPLRVSPACTGLMTDPRQMQLDHILARALGGHSTRDNCRMVCTPCNQHRGRQLGGLVTSQRHGRRQPATPTAPARQLPRW